jgi:predicted transcriptional regulator
MEVHIMPIGMRIEHVYSAIQHFKIQKLYLIIGKLPKGEKETKFIANYHKAKANTQEINDYMAKMNTTVIVKEVSAFEENSLQLFLEEVKNIVDQEKGNLIRINITGGTNLMGAAALTASYFYKTEAYYVLDTSKGGSENIENIVFLPVPRIDYTDALPAAKKKVLLMLSEKGGKVEKKTDLVDKVTFKTIQAINPHIVALAKMNLVKIQQDGKTQSVELTEAGRLVLTSLK